MPELKHETFEAPALLGELLLYEAHPDYCRESVTVAAADTPVRMGQLLVKNADGSFTPWAAGDADVDGIALRDMPASAEDLTLPVLRRAALVSSAALQWPDGTSDEQKATALAALETIGIIAR